MGEKRTNAARMSVAIVDILDEDENERDGSGRLQD